MVGGYKILDLKGNDFTFNTPVTISGIYERLKSAGKKPIIVDNFSIAGIKNQGKWLNFYVSGTDFKSLFSLYGDTQINLVVKDDDTVTLSNN